MASGSDHEMLPLLRALTRGPLDRRATEALVAGTLTRAMRIIFWVNRRKGYRIGVGGLSQQDLAYDAIAELFADEDEATGRTLRTALLPHAEAPEAQLLSVYDATLLKTIYRHLPRVFAEFDPETHQLIQALRQHVQPREDISIRDMVDGRWYIFEGDDESLLSLPAMGYDELRRRIGVPDPMNRSIAIEILRLVETLLRSQSAFRRAVPEADLLRLAMEQVSLHLGSAPEHTEPSVQHDVTVLTHVVHRAIEQVRHSLEDFYVERGRLDREEFERMLSAIRGAFIDDRLGGEPRSEYAQLREYMPGLTRERYLGSYRRRFTYMTERVMEEARRLLEKEML